MTFSFKNISYERDQHELFTKINGEITAGLCLQIMGANGAGKTTLLKIFASLLEPKEGDVFWNEHSIFKIKKEYTQNLRYIGHKNAIKQHLTIYENIHFLSSIFGIFSREQEILKIIDTIGLSKKINTLAGHLSEGQMRRLSMATLLLKKVPVWILDEPLTTLDKEGEKWMITLLNNHLNNMGLVIMATHRDLSSELHDVRILRIDK